MPTPIEPVVIAPVSTEESVDTTFTMKNSRANWFATTSIFLIITCLSVVVWMSSIGEFAQGVITLVLGRALGWADQILSFEFGTTRSNKQKDDTISTMATTAAASPAPISVIVPVPPSQDGSTK